MEDFTTHGIKSPADALERLFLEKFCCGKQLLFPVMLKDMVRILDLFSHVLNILSVSNRHA